MADYQAAVSGNSYKNNGGTVKKAGNYSSTTGPITASRTLMDDAIITQYGSKVQLSSGTAYSSGNLGTASAMTTFAYPNQAEKFIMKKVTTEVNGVSNTFLQSCAAGIAGQGRNPASLTVIRVLGSGVGTTWDYETGAITKSASAGTTSNLGSDYAAGSGITVPGYLAYKTGAFLPVRDSYEPRTSP